MPERALLQGWGRTGATAATLVPAAALDAALAGPPPRGVLARGLGRSYGDAAQNAGGTVVAMASGAPDPPTVDAEGLVTVSASTTLDELLRHLVPRGWFPPVLPGTSRATVGGAVAADVHGKNHVADGSWMAHVTAIDLALPGGDVRRLTPADDAFWATGGGMGLTGVVTSCTLQAVPIESDRLTVTTTRHADLDGVLAALARSDARYQVAWLDSGGPGRGVVTTADHAAAGALAYDPPRPRPVPPVGVVGRCSIAVLNRARWHRAPARPTTTVEPLDAFFHPLDALAGWNRLYGRHGLVQWQCAVPDGAEAVLATALERLRTAHAPSYVTVLKRFGAGDPGPLSFPMAGWTLAVDLPAAPSLAPVLDDLDRRVADAGGRIYLAKDARLAPELVPVMYPRLDEWRAVRDGLDPGGAMRSDLGRRLGLVR